MASPILAAAARCELTQAKNSTGITCTNTPPTTTLPCATINADGVVTQLTYNSQGDLTQSSTPDGNAGGEGVSYRLCK